MKHGTRVMTKDGAGEVSHMEQDKPGMILVLLDKPIGMYRNFYYKEDEVTKYKVRTLKIGERVMTKDGPGVVAGGLQ